jgi:hypothetical protein
LKEPERGDNRDRYLYEINKKNDHRFQFYGDSIREEDCSKRSERNTEQPECRAEVRFSTSDDENGE